MELNYEGLVEALEKIPHVGSGMVPRQVVDSHKRWQQNLSSEVHNIEECRELGGRCAFDNWIALIKRMTPAST